MPYMDRMGLINILQNWSTLVDCEASQWRVRPWGGASNLARNANEKSMRSWKLTWDLKKSRNWKNISFQTSIFWVLCWFFQCALGVCEVRGFRLNDWSCTLQCFKHVEPIFWLRLKRNHWICTGSWTLFVPAYMKSPQKRCTVGNCGYELYYTWLIFKYSTK